MERPSKVEPVKKTEKAKTLARKTFGKLLNEGGWMRDSDGEDRCGKCFKERSRHVGGSLLRQLKEDSKRTAQFLQDAPDTLHTSGGWWVACEGQGEIECPNEASIFVSDNGSRVEVNGQKLKK